jgi:hypothetical protein
MDCFGRCSSLVRAEVPLALSCHCYHNVATPADLPSEVLLSSARMWSGETTMQKGQLLVVCCIYPEVVAERAMVPRAAKEAHNLLCRRRQGVLRHRSVVHVVELPRALADSTNVVSQSVSPLVPMALSWSASAVGFCFQGLTPWSPWS